MDGSNASARVVPVDGGYLRQKLFFLVYSRYRMHSPYQLRQRLVQDLLHWSRSLPCPPSLNRLAYRFVDLKPSLLAEDNVCDSRLRAFSPDSLHRHIDLAS